MDRGAWQAIVHGVTESDVTKHKQIKAHGKSRVISAQNLWSHVQRSLLQTRSPLKVLAVTTWAYLWGALLSLL